MKAMKKPNKQINHGWPLIEQEATERTEEA
jgi:hypothetical protein